jgi:hypothetical protein
VFTNVFRIKSCIKNWPNAVTKLLAPLGRDRDELINEIMENYSKNQLNCLQNRVNKRGLGRVFGCVPTIELSPSSKLGFSMRKNGMYAAP